MFQLSELKKPLEIEKVKRQWALLNNNLFTSVEGSWKKITF